MVCCHQPCPSPKASELKRQVRIPSGTSRFDMAFVAYVPPADSAGPYPVPARLRLTQQRPPWPTGPLLRKGYVVPSLHAIRPDPPVSTAPPDFPRTLVIQEALPDDLVWAAIETFPALGQCSFHTCRHLYAGRRSRSISPMSPCSRRLPHQTSESAPPQSRPRLLSGGISTLPPVFALLRPARLLALLDRSDLERHRSPAAEDFLPELSLGKVALPASRVSLYGTRGGRRDRTFTGRSTAVTGCTV
jgi:hypothetical protein